VTPTSHSRSADDLPTSSTPAESSCIVDDAHGPVERLNGFAVRASGGGSAWPLILVHGAITFQGCAPLLSQPLLTNSRRVVHYYRRGYGESPPVPEDFTIVDHAADLCRLIRELGIARAHVLGHSIGAAIAMQAALDDPELVGSLVLVEPTWVSRAQLLTEFSEGMAPIVQAYAAGDAQNAAHQMLQMIDGVSYASTLGRAFGPGWFDDTVAAFHLYMRTELPSAVAWKLDAERASRLSSPVLALTGGDTLDLFKKVAQDTIAAFPSTRHVSIADAAHNVIAAGPAAAAEQIQEFLVASECPR
jgi:pimeloyl-ACP methyl ester carboxylesterase